MRHAPVLLPPSLLPLSRPPAYPLTPPHPLPAEVLGSILGALKSIVAVIGMTRMTPPIKDLLPRLTPILKNRHARSVLPLRSCAVLCWLGWGLLLVVRVRRPLPPPPDKHLMPWMAPVLLAS